MNRTNLLVFCCILAIGVWDAYVVLIQGKASNIDSSVSRSLERLGIKSKLFVFVVGAVIGHVWFAMDPECDCPIPVHEVGK